ncbi:hypothetical protein JCM8097_008555 [Rhodosporidiobolus ruineniae]
MPTHNRAGIDFNQHPPRLEDGKDANRVYQGNKGVINNPNESDEHKKTAQDEMHRFEEAERRTTEGYRGTMQNPNRPVQTKVDAATKLAELPHWSEEGHRDLREGDAAESRTGVRNP